MKNEKVYARMTNWNITYDKNDYYARIYKLLVLWTDHTWDEYEINTKVGMGNVKEMFDVSRLTRGKVSDKLCKEDAIVYIQEKIKEIESK